MVASVQARNGAEIALRHLPNDMEQLGEQFIWKPCPTILPMSSRSADLNASRHGVLLVAISDKPSGAAPDQEPHWPSLDLTPFKHPRRKVGVENGPDRVDQLISQ